MLLKTYFIAAIIGLSFIISPTVLQSQSHENMVWVELTEKVDFNDQFSTTLLWQHRVFTDREQTYQDIYWASLNAKISRNFQLSGGLIYFVYHKQSYDRYFNVPEVRPFQAITYFTQWGNVKTNFRLMLEERYMRTVSEGAILKGHDFNLRLRNRITATVPITSAIHLELSEEYLLNGQYQEVPRFDQNRAMARLHYVVKPIHLDLNVGYLHWLVNMPQQKQHRHTLMLGVKLWIN